MQGGEPRAVESRPFRCDRADTVDGGSDSQCASRGTAENVLFAHAVCMLLTHCRLPACLQADIIVMSGGNTLFACDLMERLGVVPLLRHAMERGCVMCGGSAGAICWFDAGHSDSMDPSFYVDTAAATVDGIELPPTASPEAEKEREFLLRNWKYIKVPSMGFLPGLCCPHFDKTQSNGR